MRILTITAQKPHSTGSGFYLTEMVKGFAAEGHEQAVLAGVYQEDETAFPKGVRFYPVYFKTDELPFPIAGMSDEMPYESTVYGQMTKTQEEQFITAYRKYVREAAEDFRPDMVVCHHLYLVTSIVREEITDIPVFGFCHNTDLRQLKKIPLQREYIKAQIPKLDHIFALHEEQKQEIMRIFPVAEDKITIAGTGYNETVFYRDPSAVKSGSPLRLIFAGKIAEKKGVASLIKSLDYLTYEPSELEVLLAGGAGNQEEYDWIVKLAGESRYPVRFLGKLTQQELAEYYNKSDIFVLPSFSEGLPLTIIEAMACGCKVLVTDLPGIKPWVNANIEEPPVCFVEPPEMENTDEPIPESLVRFEKDIAKGIEACAQMKVEKLPNLSRISWGNVCRLVVGAMK